MDYKKKYENALEWARQVINGECGFIRKDVEEVFPELNESEDEKIRKDVLAFIRREGQHINKYKWHKWIAWLEKQGNPTEINPSEFDLRLNKLLKQFETLPKVELESSLGFYLDVIQNDGTYKPEKQGQNEQILANSAKTCMDAWSEEDDYNVQCCIAKAVADMQTGNVGRNNELIDWLKALKQRLAL